MSNIDKHIGNRIKLQRKLLGLSREKLGNHIGLSSQQIQKYEAGISAVKPSTLFKIAEILSLDPNYFFDTYVTASSQAKVATTYDEILNQEETLEPTTKPMELANLSTFWLQNTTSLLKYGKYICTQSCIFRSKIEKTISTQSFDVGS
jgi:transcriptional regulator with XRE-family HTH domain